LIIDNKHGKIDCKVWEKDSIKIIVEIEVEGSDKEDVEEAMNNIIPHFSFFENMVEVETEITNEKKSFLERLVEAVDIFEKLDIDVDYTVWTPASTTIDIKNK